MSYSFKQFWDDLFNWGGNPPVTPLPVPPPKPPVSEPPRDFALKLLELLNANDYTDEGEGRSPFSSEESRYQYYTFAKQTALEVSLRRKNRYRRHARSREISWEVSIAGMWNTMHDSEDALFEDFYDRKQREQQMQAEIDLQRKKDEAMAKLMNYTVVKQEKPGVPTPETTVVGTDSAV